MKKSFVLIGMLGLLDCSSGETSSGSGGQSSATSTSSVTNAAATSASQTTASTSQSTTIGSSSSASSGSGGGTSVVLIDLPQDSEPYGIAVDDTHVYWTNSGTGEVMQADTDGGNQLILQSGEEFPVAVHPAAGSVYWVSYSATGELRWTPIGGGAVTSICQAPAALDFVVGDTYVWWTREPDDVQRVPIVGLPMGVDPDLLTGNPLSIGITADATNIYWVNRQDGAVKRGNPDLSGDTTLAVGDVSWGIAVDDTNVYWTEAGSGSLVGKVMQASKVDGSSVVAIATGLGRPKGIAIDATTIYWVDSENGTVQKAPIGGGTITTLVSGEMEPLSIALNATDVFWTDRVAHHIGKVAK